MDIIIWNYDTYDWFYSQWKPETPVPNPVPMPRLQPDGDYNTTFPQQIPLLFTQWIKPFNGSGISLAHDLYKVTAEEIEPSLEILSKSRYQLVDVIQCAGLRMPYANQLILKAKLSLSKLAPPPGVYSTNSGKDPNPEGYYSSSSCRLALPFATLVANLFLTVSFYI